VEKGSAAVNQTGLAGADMAFARIHVVMPRLSFLCFLFNVSDAPTNSFVLGRCLHW
jgi:hypothetical protein